MRLQGDNAAGQAPGRRQGPSGPDVPTRTGRRAGGDPPGGESSLFIPGYRDGRQAAREPAGDTPRPGGRYGWAGAAAGKGPVRGFPPAPGQPPPLYPPGQFSAWNRTPRAEDDDQAEDPWGALADLAVSDLAADVTSTQTWGAVSDGTQTSGAVSDGTQTGTWTSEPATDDGPPRGHPATDDGPPRGHPAQAAGAGAPGTQRGRARGHGTGAHSSRTGPRARRKPSRGLLAAGLAVLVALGGGTYALLRGEHGSAAADQAAKLTHPHTSPSPAASTPAPAPTPTLGPWGHIESRTADPLPLTLAEVFPATFTADASYARTIRRQGKNCPAAVVGGQLQQAVRPPGCSQVLRASYLSVSKKLMGTIGVLNLKTFKAAEQAGKAAGPAEFIAQLAAAKGPTRNLTKGTGIEQAAVKGHYLILVWAEFTTLHKPKTNKQRKELETFLSLLIDKTANVSLTSRMVTGKP
jgi:hypothetical protein